jgi:hypothetical protein
MGKIRTPDLAVEELGAQQVKLEACRLTRGDAGEGYGAFREVLWRKVRERTLFSKNQKP